MERLRHLVQVFKSIVLMLTCQALQTLHSSWSALTLVSRKKPPWLISAEKELGQEEIAGEEHNTRILAYHLETTLMATEDEVPWCSSFVCAMFEWNKIPSTRSAAARSWLKWGQALEKPIEGCVVVFKRGQSAWAGHVGFYVGENEGNIFCLGGNQSDSVKVSLYPKDDVLGYRWPQKKHWEANDTNRTTGLS